MSYEIQTSLQLQETFSHLLTKDQVMQEAPFSSKKEKQLSSTWSHIVRAALPG